MSVHPAQRILICFHDFSMGGTERVAIGLAKAWLEAGRDVTILCGTEAGPQRALVDRRVNVVQLDPPITRSPLSRIKLGRAMGKLLPGLTPDIIFLPGNFHLLLANSLRDADSRPSIVLKVSNPPAPYNHGKRIVDTMFRYFARGVDAFAPMNAGLESTLRQLLPDKLITTRHDPVYISGARLRTLPARASDAAIKVIWAGRLEPQKDVLLALATLKALIQIAPAHLTLLGDGSQHAATTKQIAALGLEANVTRAGHVPCIEPYMRDADALLITSHYEGGPAVAVEALAHGVPVVSTNCSTLLHDLLTQPEAGEIVRSRNPGSLALALRATIQRRSSDAPMLAKLVAHLEPQACALAYLSWFDDIVLQRTT